MQSHFEKNGRLAWAFKICRALGIDDPCHWMDTVDPLLLDRWIAYEKYEQGADTKDDSPMAALKQLESL